MVFDLIAGGVRLQPDPLCHTSIFVSSPNRAVAGDAVDEGGR